MSRSYDGTPWRDHKSHAKHPSSLLGMSVRGFCDVTPNQVGVAVLKSFVSDAKIIMQGLTNNGNDCLFENYLKRRYRRPFADFFFRSIINGLVLTIDTSILFYIQYFYLLIFSFPHPIFKMKFSITFVAMALAGSVVGAGNGMSASFTSLLACI
jgi:hypothetical protein